MEFERYLCSTCNFSLVLTSLRVSVISSIFILSKWLGLDIFSYLSNSFSISRVSRNSRSLRESDQKTFVAKCCLTFRNFSLDSFKGGLISERFSLGSNLQNKVPNHYPDHHFFRRVIWHPFLAI